MYVIAKRPNRHGQTTHHIAGACTIVYCLEIGDFVYNGTSQIQTYIAQKDSTKIAKDFSVSNFYGHYWGLSSAFHAGISFCADTDRPVPHQQMKIYIPF